MPTSNLRTPYTTYRAKTEPSARRAQPGRLGKAELADLLAEDLPEDDD